MIEITQKMLDLATKCSKETIASFKSPINYTGLKTDDRFLTGYLGEFVFMVYCFENNIDFEYHLQITGLPDGEDFILFDDKGNRLTVDIKTASKGWHKKIMLPKAQFEKYDYDYYIGVRLDGNIGQVFGYCTKDDFKETFVKIPTMEKDLLELRDLSNLNLSRKGNFKHNING